MYMHKIKLKTALMAFKLDKNIPGRLLIFFRNANNSDKWIKMFSHFLVFCETPKKLHLFKPGTPGFL